MSNSYNKSNFTLNEQIAYEKLCDKRLAYDNLMWQTPVLGITAQSFLYTIAFNTENSWYAKVFSSILILILGTATIQLLLKHRYHEVLTSKRLLKIEKENGLIQIHSKPEKVKKENRWFLEYWLLKISSFKVWIFALSITTCFFFIPLVVACVNNEKINKVDITVTRPKVEISTTNN